MEFSIRPDDGGNTGFSGKHEGWETAENVVDPLDHLKLVHATIRRIRVHGAVEHDDLFQEGCFGLLKACRTFDPKRGIKFSTYAVWWIFSYAKRASDRELAAHGWSRIRKSGVARVRHTVVIPFSSIDKNEESRGRDTDSVGQVADPREFKPAETYAELEKQWLCDLSDRERLVLRGRLVEHRTLAEVGEEFGVSKERIRQIECEAFRKAKDRWHLLKGRQRLGVAL